MEEKKTDIENANTYHKRILAYLMYIYPKKARTVYSISKFFKKGREDKYMIAKKELKEFNHIIESSDGISLNPDREEYSIWINAYESNPSIQEDMKRNVMKLLNIFLKKKHEETLEETYKIHKSKNRF